MEKEMKEMFDVVIGQISTLSSKVDALDSKVDALDAKVVVLEEGQKEMRQDIAEVRDLAMRTALKVENVIEPKLQILYENQVSLLEHSKMMESHDVRLKRLETDVYILKTAFQAANHG